MYWNRSWAGGGNSKLGAHSRVVLAVGVAICIAGCRDSAKRPARIEPGDTGTEIRRLYDSFRADFPGVRGVTPEELVQLRAEREVVLVDVREPEERAVSTIPGSITREEFEREKAAIGGRPVVAYCTIGYRSGKYVARLNRDGIAALNLEGSILAWVNAGQVVVDPGGMPVRRVHTYGRQWALLPADYEAVY